MKNFDLKKLKGVKVLGYVAAIIAGLMTISEELDNIKKEKQIEDLETRLSNLEKGNKEAH